MGEVDSSKDGRVLGCGDVIGGHYRIEGVLGEGGMAVVYRARNTATDKACALKVLHAKLGARSEFMSLFAKEAKIGSVVGDSRYIVRVFDAGFDTERRLPFIVMELLHGLTLQQAMFQGHLGRAEVVCIMQQLGEALSQAHDAGVIHRDLKPSNIFLDQSHGQQQVKVMDFGIAKVVADEALRTATQIGTPAYTAPEQMGAATRRLAERQGIRIARGVCPATDVWALGLIGYEMLVGARPGQYWDVETMAELPMKIAFESLDLASVRAAHHPRSLPPGFDAWFRRCLEKDAADRFPTIAAAIAALMRCLAADGGDESPRRKAATESNNGPNPIARTVASGPSRVSLKSESESEDLLPHVSTPPPLSPLSDPDGQAATQVYAVAANDTGDPVVVTQLAESKTPSSRRSRPTAGLSSGDDTMRPRSHSSSLGTWALMVLIFAATMGVLARQDGSAAAAAGSGCEALDRADAHVVAQCQHDCDAGKAQACSVLAEHYGKGSGDRSQRQSQVHYQLKACGVGTQVDAKGWQQRSAQARCEPTSCIPSDCVKAARHFAGIKNSSKERGIATALLERSCQHEKGAEPLVAGCIELGRLQRAAGNAAAARSSYRLACDGGQMAACVALADDVATDIGNASRSRDRRVRGLYQRACDGENLEGCRGLAALAAAGRGGWARNYSLAQRLRQRACRGGVGVACVALGVAYRDGGEGLAVDSLRAERLLRTACDTGTLSGCAELGTLLSSSSVHSVGAAQQAYTHNKKACDGKVAKGCVQLAGMLRTGAAGLRSDPQRERQLLEKACAADAKMGCEPLVRFLRNNGLGVSKTWSSRQKQACNQGSSARCFLLARLHAAGDLLAKDSQASALEFGQACDAGHARACTALANLRFDGAEGVPVDRTASFRLNQKACRGGDSVGCSRLALLHGMGQGTAKNLKRARQLHGRVCGPATSIDNAAAPEAASQQRRCSAIAALLASTGSPGHDQKTKGKSVPVGVR